MESDDQTTGVGPGILVDLGKLEGLKSKYGEW